jgi:DNA-binding transcriptional regulator LsrR (DeoR family)
MDPQKLEKKLDLMIDLLRRLVAMQLFQSGATMDEICKNLHTSKTDVVKLLKGAKKKA